MDIKSLIINKIPYSLAMDLIIKNHYLHRKAPCSQAFGLFKNDEIVGCIIYGTPASRSLQVGICGKDEANNTIELTRLWICDSIGKNAESYLIGNTIPLVNKEIIVSYAEHQQGHYGIVYQATNWIYTGLSDKHCQWFLDGRSAHSRHLLDDFGGINKAKIALGNRLIKQERPRKHRYIYFNCSKTRKKQLLNKLKYNIKPYPKADGQIR